MDFILPCLFLRSCAFVFLPPVREADACLDDCEDLAFCGDLAVDVDGWASFYFSYSIVNLYYMYCCFPLPRYALLLFSLILRL